MMSMDLPPEQEPGPPAPERRGWKFFVPLVTAAAGLMFAMSFSAAQGTDLRSERDLPALIVERDENVATKAQQVEVLQAQVDGLAEEAAPADERLSALKQQAERVADTAGSTAIGGPGISVSLTDAPVTGDTLPDGFSPDDVVVHQQDVQAVVNALWAGGAEGMMIQDQRVISTSAVRCVGNTLILQGRVYSPPYVITAIGDVSGMEASLELDPTVSIYREYVDAVGLGYDVRYHDSLEFPAYAAPVDLEHAVALR
jgi:uncharacterized protein YlxW (UPF0749 family)